MRASAAMTRDVVCITSDDNLQDAYEIMTEWEIRHLPVMEGEELVGILSDRDVLLRSKLDVDGDLAVPNQSVSEAMTRLPIVCSPQESIAEIGQAMLDHKIDSVPIVGNDGELVGLVTSSDLIQLLIDKERAQLTHPIPLRFAVHQATRPGMATSLR